MRARPSRSALLGVALASLFTALTALAARAVAQAPSSGNAAAADAEQSEATSSMDEEAREHFRIGKTLYDAGRFPEAAGEFELAYQKSQRPQLLYNIYVAQRDAGNWDAAIGALRGYLDKFPDAPDRINLRARLKSMEEAATRSAEQARKAREEEARAQRAARQSAPVRVEKERSVVPYVLMGAGAAFALTGGVTGLITRSKTSDLEAACDGTACPLSEADTIDSAKRMAVATDVLLGAGIVTAGVGAVLFFTGVLDRERRVPTANLRCGARGCEATWTGRF